MLWGLILAHLIGDFLLQGEFILKLKKYIYGLMFHSAVCTICVILIVPSLPFEALILIFTSHILFDWLKIKIANKYPSLDNIILFLLDQFLHFVIIFAISIFWEKINFHSPLFIKYLSFYCIVGPASTILLFYFKKLFYKDEILRAFSKESLYNALERILVFTLVLLPYPSYFLIPFVLIGRGCFFGESPSAFLDLLASTIITISFGIVFKILWII